MNASCAICTLEQQHFYCQKCTTSNLEKHHDQFQELQNEISNLKLLENKLPDDFNEKKIDLIDRVDWLEYRVSQKQLHLDRLKQRALKLQNSIKSHWIEPIPIPKQEAIKVFQDKGQVRQYQVQLIHNLILIFRLRKVHRTTRDSTRTKSIEYRIVNVGFPSLNQIPTLSTSQQQKLNCCLFYTVQLTMMISFYLSIPLPFPLLFGPVPKVKLQEYIPIALSDSIDVFITALSTLNFNIAYLCHARSISIPLDQTHSTLEMIAKCCSSSEFGFKSDFELEIEDVIEHHTTVMNTKPWELLQYDSSNEQWDMV